MRRHDLIREIERLGAVFIREGSRHTLYEHPVTREIIAVPRHNEIREQMAKRILRQLQ